MRYSPQPVVQKFTLLAKFVRRRLLTLERLACRTLITEAAPADTSDTEA